MKSEDLQLFVHDIRSTVNEAKLKRERENWEAREKRERKRMKLTDSDSVVGKSAESFQTRQQNDPELELPEEPELLEEPELPVTSRRDMWQSYFI